jgi:hypothetical protein
MTHGGINKVVDLVLVKGVAAILVELSEDGIDGLSELLIGIAHSFFKIRIQTYLIPPVKTPENILEPWDNYTGKFKIHSFR